jgi:hypothetical protein
MALAPAVAHAAKAELSRDGTELHVDSGINEASNLQVTSDGTKFIVADLSGGDVNPGRDCSNFASKAARCDGGFTKVIVDLGANDDTFQLKVNKAVTVDGGSGRDVITTNNQNDKVDGGSGNDVITTAGSFDNVDAGLGDDSVSGGDGQDSIRGGAGDDTVHGDADADHLSGGLFSSDGVAALTVGGTDVVAGDGGNDNLDSDPGPDQYSGGPGEDELNYNRYTTHVSVLIDDLPNDGRSGEGDNVGSDVESIFAGTVGDTLVGGAGDETLNGFSGADNLTGGPGGDFFFGDTGDDVINAREDPPTAFKDEVFCGKGTDTAAVDLTDHVGNAPAGDEVCETVERAPVGQGPNVRIARKRIKVSRSGRVRIPLSCPRAQSHGCRGTLKLSGSRGKARFNLSPGTKTVARRRLDRKHRRRLRKRRRGVRLKAVARERDPLGRPKTTSTIFRLRLRKS